jgi:HSP20 family molecular chaperone IbpA
MATVLIERVRHLKGEEKPPAFAEVEKTTEQIQQKAFSLFMQHGGLPGFDLDNWLLAEREVLGPSAAELVESEKELKLRVAVPGAEARDLRVTATPEAIIVEANTRHDHSGTDGELRFCEFSENKVCRQFGLPWRSTSTRFRRRWTKVSWRSSPQSLRTSKRARLGSV